MKQGQSRWSLRSIGRYVWVEMGKVLKITASSRMAKDSSKIFSL